MSEGGTTHTHGQTDTYDYNANAANAPTRHDADPTTTANPMSMLSFTAESRDLWLELRTKTTQTNEPRMQPFGSWIP